MAHQKWARGRALQARTELGLARLSEQGAARDAINCAIRRLYAAAASQADGQVSRSKRSQRDEVSRALGKLPLEITPVVDGSSADL